MVMGSSFTISCSILPQYPGGSFQLVLTTSATSQNYTLPAVNHSAHFLFSAADRTHQGDYRCVYHIYVFSQHFSSESQPLYLTVSGNFIKNLGPTGKCDTDNACRLESKICLNQIKSVQCHHFSCCCNLTNERTDK